MAKRIQLRVMSEQEQSVLARLSTSRKAASSLVKRATMIVRYYAGASCRQIGRELQMAEETVSRWVHRFQEAGLDGLRDEPRSGRPAIYRVDEISCVIHTALSSPQELGLPFGSWTLDRLHVYLQEKKGLAMKRSRIDEILLKEGYAGDNKSAGLVCESIRTSPKKGGHCRALPKATRWERRPVYR